jgi:hypothetical protein
MPVIISTVLAVLFFGLNIVFYVNYHKSKKKLHLLEKQIAQINQLHTAQKDFEQILSTGISAFLHISIKKSLEKLEIIQQQLTESEELNLELTQWVVDFGKLTENVYKQLKSIDDRGIFESDDDVGILFQDMVNIITEYNSRINNTQRDDKNYITDKNE